MYVCVCECVCVCVYLCVCVCSVADPYSHKARPEQHQLVLTLGFLCLTTPLQHLDIHCISNTKDSSIEYMSANSFFNLCKLITILLINLIDNYSVSAIRTLLTQHTMSSAFEICLATTGSVACGLSPYCHLEQYLSSSNLYNGGT